MTLNLDHTHSPNTIPVPCRGCQHYYGRLDGGIRLNCGMYPFGPTESQCPDYEEVTATAENPRTRSALSTYQATTIRDPWEMPTNALDRWAMVRRMVRAMHQVVEDLSL